MDIPALCQSVVRLPFTVITNNEHWIFVADIARVFLVIVSILLMAAALRMILVTNQALYRWRGAAMFLFLLSLAGTEYGRMGEPVTTRLPLHILAITCGLITFRMGAKDVTKKPPTRLDED